MIVLGLDLETTGLDFGKDRIIEFAGVLWDTEHGTPLRMVNMLHRDEGDEPISDEITAITGITNEMLEKHGVPRTHMVSALGKMAFHAEAIVAHNGNAFDRPMLHAELERHGKNDGGLLWIDTMLDVPYPESIGTRKLPYLAAEHGFLNPFAHRALFDVLTMLRVMQGYEMDPILLSARQPMVTLQAMVSFEARDKAKALGYHWKAESKSWRKDLKAHRVPAEEEKAREAGFAIKQLASPLVP